MKNSENPDRAGGNTPAANPRGSVRFGPFTLDLHARKLWRDEALVALPSRALEALAYLVAHRDRAVDRYEIIAAAWHDVAVTDLLEHCAGLAAYCAAGAGAGAAGTWRAAGGTEEDAGS